MSSPAEPHQTSIPGHSWYALTILMLALVIHNVDRSIMSILIQPIGQEFGLSDSQMGLLTGLAFALFFAVACIPMGMLVDRVNRKKLLATLMVMWSACTALCGLAQGFWSLFAARTVVGVSEAGGNPAAFSLLGDLFPPSKRSLAIGLYTTGTTVGAATALVVGGIVAQNYGWRAAFLVAGIPGIILAIVLLLTVREPKRGSMEIAQPTTDVAPPLSQVWRATSRNPAFVAAFLGMTLIAVVGSGTLIWVATFFVRVHDLSLFQAGMTAGLAALTFGSIGTVAGGFLGDRLIRRGGLARSALVPLGACIFAALAGLLMVSAPTLIGAMIGLALWELSLRSYFGPGNNLILSTVEPRMRGLVSSALQVTVNLIGWALGPLIVGAVSDIAGGSDGIRWGIGTLQLFAVIPALCFLFAAVYGARKQHSTIEAVAK